MDEIRTALSIFAIAVSIASLYVARRSWLQSNRPIVTAVIVENAVGNIGAVFDLMVSNTGNRPATKIQMKARPEHIDNLMVASVEEKRRLSIHACFSDEAMIPLLKNGEELRTSFGSTGSRDSGAECLNYGAELTITITYRDIEGRSYTSIVPLKVHFREGFGGGTWK